ncbi:MAG: fumarylacetoacetate hydrolase family protein [Pseudomonadota bacterium]
MVSLVKFLDGATERLGVLRDGAVFDVAAPTVEGYGDPVVALIRQVGDDAAAITPTGPGRPLDAVTLTAPITRPSKNVLCVGLNYHAHAKEFSSSGYDTKREPSGKPAPTHPIVFTKAACTVTGPYSDVVVPWDVTNEVDYEGELGVVIGRGGRGINKENAYDHVWGYTVINDVTARDLQRNHAQWFLGKSIDTFCPMGPAIVTADAVDPEALRLQCWVNGDLRQDAVTRDLIFDIPTLIETISASVTLEPGDVIATGTPQGVGIGFDPPRFLKRDDVVRVEISGLGHIENRIV